MHEKRHALSPEAFKNQIVSKIGHDKLFSWANEKGIKRWVIETIERGKIPSKHEHLVALAEALDVSLDWLLTGEEEKPKAESVYYKSTTTIGERLRVLREEKLSLSREKFVEGLDITPKDLDSMENDAPSPDAEFIYRVWMKYHDRIGLDDLDWLITGNRREAAEDEAEYKASPTTTPEEKEYLEKLLQVLRNPATKKAIQENLDTFLKVPRPELPLGEKEKKGGMAS